MEFYPYNMWVIPQNTKDPLTLSNSRMLDDRDDS